MLGPTFGTGLWSVYQNEDHPAILHILSLKPLWSGNCLSAGRHHYMGPTEEALMDYRIALIPGDGIGPEVVDANIPILERLADQYSFSVHLERFDWGSERYLSQGNMFPDAAPAMLESFDAIFHGAMGDPRVPDHISSRQGHHRIREAFDQYMNIRPGYLFNPDLSPLRGYEAGDIDIQWYRENTEGEYTNMGGRMNRGGSTELAIQSAIYTRSGIDRILRAAFEAAQERSGRVSSITKSNVLSHGLVFWDEMVQEVSQSYPDVDVEELHVDAAALALVERPESFDVIVAPNLFSDILTDQVAGIIGGLGMAPSANLNPDKDVPGMFEPVHGSAPDIAGEGLANPIAAALSMELLLRDLNEIEAAEKLWRVITEQLSDSDAPRTPDLRGDAGTEDVCADLLHRLA